MSSLVALPATFTFFYNNKAALSIQLVDGEDFANNINTYINDATVTATLYKGRDIADPITTPGVAVVGFNAISLVYVVASNGLYRAVVTTGASPVGTDYVLVFSATTPGGAQNEWEEKAVVAVRSSS